MRPFDFQFPPRIVGGTGTIEGIGRLVHDLGTTHVFLVGDGDCARAGHLARIVKAIEREGLAVVGEYQVVPSTLESSITATLLARLKSADVIVAVGSEAVLSASKTVGRFLANDRSGFDRPRGAGRATRRVPVISIPSLLAAGRTNAEPTTGDSRTVDTNTSSLGVSGFATVVLDAEVSAGTPRETLAAVTVDSTTHAVEAWASTRRTEMSDLCAREAWRLLAGNFLQVLTSPDDTDAMSAVLLGSVLATIAAEHSALGAVHACARPVSRHYGVAHGPALALLLPEVVRWNSRVAGARYAELAAVRGQARRPETLVAQLEDLVAAGEFPESLAAAGVVERELPTLAAEASTDEMGTFNPRKFDVAGALEIYAAAY